MRRDAMLHSIQQTNLHFAVASERLGFAEELVLTRDLPSLVLHLSHRAEVVRQSRRPRLLNRLYCLWDRSVEGKGPVKRLAGLASGRLHVERGSVEVGGDDGVLCSVHPSSRITKAPKKICPFPRQRALDRPARRCSDQLSQ